MVSRWRVILGVLLLAGVGIALVPVLLWVGADPFVARSVPPSLVVAGAVGAELAGWFDKRDRW